MMLTIVLLAILSLILGILMVKYCRNQKSLEDLGRVSYDYETSKIRQKIISYHILDKHGPLVHHLYEMNAWDKGWD